MPRDVRRRTATGTDTSPDDAPAPVTDATPDTPEPNNARAKIDKSGLYDLAQVKRLLDDEVIAFMEDQGYVEAVLVSNIKIIAGSIAVAAALYSHFNPWEFPANRNLVLACVLLYSVCIGSISVASYFWEANAVYVGKLAAKAKQVTKGKLPVKVWVETRVGEKGSSAYRATIRTSPRQSDGKVEIKHGYESYFTEEGRFLVERFRSDMTHALSQVSGGSKKSN